MTDIRLFNITQGVTELTSYSATLERELQGLIERNMPVFFGVTFLASEYVTSNGGRIDSLGMDENNCPVIFEYKRTSNENVINQGLFYLDWLMDHKAEFELLVMKALGKEYSEKIDWTLPRLICIAGDFTKYDEYAVKQINRNIDLIRYKKFGEGLLLFELINTSPVKSTKEEPRQGKDKTVEYQLKGASTGVTSLYTSLRDYLLGLGDDVTENHLKHYIAFKKMKNFVCVELRSKALIMYLRLNPTTVGMEDGFTRDVSNIGHWGTGDLEVTLKSPEDFIKAQDLLKRCYDIN